MELDPILIVAYYAKRAGWIPPEWMAIAGVSVALFFLAASSPNAASHRLYERMSARLRRFERAEPIDVPEPIPPADALVFGMGRVGSGAYEEMCTRFGTRGAGVDVDPAGADAVFDFYAQAGSGLAERAADAVLGA